MFVLFVGVFCFVWVLWFLVVLFLCFCFCPPPRLCVKVLLSPGDPSVSNARTKTGSPLVKISHLPLLRVSGELSQGVELPPLGFSLLFQNTSGFFFEQEAICPQRGRCHLLTPKNSVADRVSSPRQLEIASPEVDVRAWSSAEAWLPGACPGEERICILDSWSLQFLLELTFFIDLEADMDARLLIFRQVARPGRAVADRSSRSLNETVREESLGALSQGFLAQHAGRIHLRISGDQLRVKAPAVSRRPPGVRTLLECEGLAQGGLSERDSLGEGRGFGLRVLAPWARGKPRVELGEGEGLAG